MRIISGKRPYAVFENWDFPNLVHGFTLRSEEGFFPTNVLAPDFGSKISTYFSQQQVIYALQVHKSDIFVANQSSKAPVGAFDGLITSEKNLLLAAFFADCVPVFAFDEKKKIAGIFHCGWRGVKQKIAVKGIEKMKQAFNSPISNLKIGIGPGIRRCCYQVSPQLINDFRVAFPNYSSFYNLENNHLDLVALICFQLLELGVKPANLNVAPFCTSCKKQLFYSYRREGGNALRMAGFIGFKGEG